MLFLFALVFTSANVSKQQSKFRHVCGLLCALTVLAQQEWCRETHPSGVRGNFLVTVAWAVEFLRQAIDTPRATTSAHVHEQEEDEMLEERSDKEHKEVI